MQHAIDCQPNILIFFDLRLRQQPWKKLGEGKIPEVRLSEWEGAHVKVIRMLVDCPDPFSSHSTAFSSP